jgi:hypothetical protein
VNLRDGPGASAASASGFKRRRQQRSGPVRVHFVIRRRSRPECNRLAALRFFQPNGSGDLGPGLQGPEHPAVTGIRLC